MKLSLTLNGEETVLEARPDERLLDVLRREGLISAKEGCAQGRCGACAVLLDGKPVPSCIVRAGLVSGSSVETLEGFSKSEHYEVIMRGFGQAGIRLCGYCDAGRILTAYSVIATCPRPDRAQLEAATAHMTCCCTESETYLNGIMYAVALSHKRAAGSGRHGR